MGRLADHRLALLTLRASGLRTDRARPCSPPAGQWALVRPGSPCSPCGPVGPLQTGLALLTLRASGPLRTGLAPAHPAGQWGLADRARPSVLHPPGPAGPLRTGLAPCSPCGPVGNRGLTCGPVGLKTGLALLTLRASGVPWRTGLACSPCGPVGPLRTGSPLRASRQHLQQQWVQLSLWGCF